MHIGLYRLISSSKKTHISLIAATMTLIIVMSALPLASAHSGDIINAPYSTVIPTIDSFWSGGEWDDAPQQTMSNISGGAIGYIRTKNDGTSLYVLIDLPWDNTPSGPFWHENVWLAFDPAHDDGGAPQWDDVLVGAQTGFMAGTGWKGNGTGWVTMWLAPGGQFATVQGGEGFGTVPMSTSPNSGTPHRIIEMKVPLSIIGSPGSTVGFYAMAVDDNTTNYSQWPQFAAGGNPWAWPGAWGPTPAPSAWGNLVLGEEPPPPPPVGGIASPIIIAPTSDMAGTLIGLTSLIALIAVTVIFAKHRRKK